MSTPKIDFDLIERYFKEGSEVEISSYDKENLGSWYSGTVIRLNRKSLTAVVEYESLKDEMDQRKPLIEKVDLVQLRPLQLLQERRDFAVNEYVDLFFHGGWWEGMVTRFSGERIVFIFKHTRELRVVKVSKLRPHHEWVYGKWHPELDEEPDESPEIEVPVIMKRGVVNEVPPKSPMVEVRERKIKSREAEVQRPLREFEVPRASSSKQKTQSRKVEVPSFAKHKNQSRKVEVPAFKKLKYSHSKEVQLIPDLQIVPLSAGMPISARYSTLDEQSPRGFKPGELVELSSDDEQAPCGFKPGQLVELSSDDEGFKGAWLPATVIQTLNAHKYIVEYEHIFTDDEKSKLIETVDSKHMRPCPPVIPRVDRFGDLEYVDALYNDCWWAGAISKVLIDNEYIVYFGDEETIKFRHSQLRVQQKWINGQWVTPPKALQLQLCDFSSP